MGGPVFDRQVFVKKQSKEKPPSRNLLPGAAILLLVAALAAFATYRFVRAGGAVPSNPADQARIQELQTKLKQAQDQVQELQKRRHVSPARHLADDAEPRDAQPAASQARHETATGIAAHSARHVTSAAGTTANSSAADNFHPAASKTEAAAPPQASSASADDHATAELKTQLAKTQAASNQKIDLLQNDLAANHEEWQATVNRLGNVVGQLDSQQTALQRTQNSINYLLARAHQSDVSFTLTKDSGLQRVGPISMKLSSTSVKGQHYTVRMIVDDKTVELKDRALNEVVEFYTARSKYPLRLIVSRIERGKVSGTLAVPNDLSQEANNPQFHQLQQR